MKKQIILAAIASLLFVGSSFAQSADSAGDQFPIFAGHGIEFMVTALDLNAQQQTAIKAIAEQAHTKLGPLMQEAQDFHKQLQAAAFSDNFDPASVRSLVETHKASLEDLIVGMAQTESDVLKVLTPQQRTKLQQLMAQHHEYEHHMHHQ